MTILVPLGVFVAAVLLVYACLCVYVVVTTSDVFDEEWLP